jgi:hypothetical protein
MTDITGVWPGIAMTPAGTSQTIQFGKYQPIDVAEDCALARFPP